MAHFVLPDLYCPFPSLVNPHTETVEKGTIEWARRFNLLSSPSMYQRLMDVKVGWLVGRTYPYTTVDALQLLADWCTWLFLQDDQCDELGVGKEPRQVLAMHRRSLAVLGGAATISGDRPLTLAMADLRDRIIARAPDGWMPRFLRTVREAFEASIWEASNRARGIIPDVAIYMEKRPYTGGLYMMIALIEVVEPISIPESVLEDPAVRRLTQHAANAVCWVNDIVSLAKEIRQGDVHNLVLALQKKHHLSLQQSLYRAAALHDSEVRAFMDEELRLPSFGAAIDRDLKEYITILRAWMRGNLDWSYLSGRYLRAVNEVA